MSAIVTLTIKSRARRRRLAVNCEVRGIARETPGRKKVVKGTAASIWSRGRIG